MFLTSIAFWATCAAADVPECGSGDQAWVDVNAHEIAAKDASGAVIAVELPVCGFLKIHTNHCLLGMCFGTYRLVEIPVRYDEATGRYISEARRVDLHKQWVPGNPSCWEIPEHEIFEVNIGAKADPERAGGRTYLEPGDPARDQAVMLSGNREDLYHACN